MKNYPHLYPTPISKKVNQKTPVKNKLPVNSTFNYKPSFKTMPRSPLSREIRGHSRNLTRSIEGSNLYYDV